MAMAYMAAGFCFLLTFLNLISVGLAATRARPRPTPLPPPRAAPAVSIVRPLCGLDNFCEETVESSFWLDYPAYEIIFCVARASDPVVPLVQRLIARHPDRPGADDRRRRTGESQSEAEQLRARMGRSSPRLDHSRRRQCIDAEGLYPAASGELAEPYRPCVLHAPWLAAAKSLGRTRMLLFSTPSRRAGSIAPKPWDWASPKARPCCGGAR